MRLANAFAILISLLVPAFAQTQASQTQPGQTQAPVTPQGQIPPPAVPASPTTASSDLILTEATCRAPFRNEGSQSCRLGDTVLVRFANLNDWVKADPVKHDPTNLILALNNHALTGTHPNVLIANANVLTFDLTVPEGSDPDAEANKQAWRTF